LKTIVVPGAAIAAVARGTIVVVTVALLTACAAPPTSSEKEWARGQCAQITDREAHEKCLERVGK
jgi:hypothetical protein